MNWEQKHQNNQKNISTYHRTSSRQQTGNRDLSKQTADDLEERNKKKIFDGRKVDFWTGGGRLTQLGVFPTVTLLLYLQ